MKNKYIYPILTALACVPLLQADWIPVVDFDSYTPGDGYDELLNAGWIFQDGNYVGYQQCTDGTWDCDAVREVVESPFNPSGGSANSIKISGGNENSPSIANGGSNTSHLLPQEIPVGGKATFYMRLAVDEVGYKAHYLILSRNVLTTIQGDVATYPQWAQAGSLMSLERDGRMTAYSGGYLNIDPTSAENSKLQVGEWYELWLHVDNQSNTEGDKLGTRYDLYIRGGQFGDGEPVHIVNSEPAFVSNGFTFWRFREIANAPVKSFILLSQYGNPDPAATIHGTAPTYINAMAMYPDDFVLSTPDDGGTADWNGYPVTTDGWADTGDWMGWLHVENDPWVYSYSLASWVYLGGDVDSSGAWTYFLK